jgi:hypothetical protein
MRKGGKMKKDPVLSRRKFLQGSVLGAGAVTAGFGAGLLSPGTAHAAAPTLPLPYYYVDPDEVRKRAWQNYFTGG